MKDTTIAVDISKDVFEIAVSRKPGKVSERRRLSRAKFEQFLVNQSPATVVMEACGCAHHWGRRVNGLGHEARLLPTLHTKPYVRRNKTDRADASGLLEANRNENIHSVPVKSVDQQVLTSVHRCRSAWMKTRTARVNLGRGILRELGIFIALGRKRFLAEADALVEDAEAEMPDVIRSELAELVSEIRELERKIDEADRQLKALGKQNPAVELLESIPGIGNLTATALVGFVGPSVHRFGSCRKFANSFGLTPREFSSGHHRFLGKINKQGNTYLRTLLTHGARSILLAASKHSKQDELSVWALQVQQRRGHNIAAIATANKLARIVYAVLKRGSEYELRAAS